MLPGLVNILKLFSIDIVNFQDLLVNIQVTMSFRETLLNGILVCGVAWPVFNSFPVL